MDFHKKSKNRKRFLVHFALCFVALFSIIVSHIVTSKIAESKIAIGLDLIHMPSSPPVISFDSRSDTIEMEPISEKYSTSNTLLDFEIIATGKKNENSSGTEVIASGLSQSWRIDRARLFRKHKNYRKADRITQVLPFDSFAVSDDGWDISSDSQTITSNYLSTTASTFHFKNYLPVHVTIYSKSTYKPERENQFSFYLSHSPRGGIAKIKTPTKEEIIDLYSETETKSRVDVNTIVSKNFRYYTSLPRHKYKNLKIFFDTDSPPDIYRLYIASFIPKSFFKTKRQPLYVMGSVTENWIPNFEDGCVALPSIPVWEKGGTWTFIAVFLFSNFTLIITILTAWPIVYFIRHLLKPSCHHYKLESFKWKYYLRFLWPILLVLLIWFFCSYPGFMSPDSVSQWKQAHGDKKLFDATPVFHTMIWKALFLLWDSPAVIITLHVVAMSFVLAYAYNLLWRLGVPKIAIVIALLSSVLSIRNGSMAVLLWKGTLLAIVVLLITILMLKLLTDKKSKSLFYWVFLGIALALCPLLRHNGLSIFLGMIVLLPLFFWHARSRAFLSILIAVLFYGAVKFLMIPALDVRPYPQTHMPAHKIARYLVQDIPLVQEEYELVDRNTLLFKEKWFYTNITSGGAIWKWVNWPMAQDTAKYKEVMKIFEPAKFIGIRILSYFHRHKYILWPPYSKYDGLIETQCNTNYLTIEMAEEYGFKCPNGFSKTGQKFLTDWLRQTLKPGFIWICWRGGVHFGLLLVALIICLFRCHDYRLMVVFLPVILHAAGLLVVDASQCARLLFPMTFSTGFLICFALLPNIQQSNKATDATEICDKKSE